MPVSYMYGRAFAFETSHHNIQKQKRIDNLNDEIERITAEYNEQYKFVSVQQSCLRKLYDKIRSLNNELNMLQFNQFRLVDTSD